MEPPKKPRAKKKGSSSIKRPAAVPIPDAPLCVVVPEALVGVDYPGPDEIVISPSYTFRIGTIGAVRAEVSIDGGPWTDCRQAVGYWWHDWSGYGSGPHRVSARILTSDGRTLASKSRMFTVRLAVPASV